MASIHVHPVGDAVAHELSDDCVCGPAQEAVHRDDGSIGWLAVHHPLDNRL